MGLIWAHGLRVSAHGWQPVRQSITAEGVVRERATSLVTARKRQRGGLENMWLQGQHPVNLSLHLGPTHILVPTTPQECCQIRTIHCGRQLSPEGKCLPKV